MAKHFKHPYCNKVLRAPEGMKNVTDLALFVGGGRCISAHKLSFRERISALVFGTVWLDLISGDSQPPCMVTVQRSYFEKPKKP